MAEFWQWIGVAALFVTVFGYPAFALWADHRLVQKCKQLRREASDG